MDSFVGNSFEFPFTERRIHFSLFVHDVLCLVVHVKGRRQKNYSIGYYDRDNSQNKTKVYVDSGKLELHTQI
jgi:hypothetical protein